MPNIISLAKDWLEKQRKTGIKYLEIKVRGDYHYVYNSPNSYNKKSKKVVKCQFTLVDFGSDETFPDHASITQVYESENMRFSGILK